MPREKGRNRIPQEVIKKAKKYFSIDRKLAIELQSVISGNDVMGGKETAYGMVMSEIKDNQQKFDQCLEPYLLEKDIYDLLSSNYTDFEEAMEGKNYSIYSKREDALTCVPPKVINHAKSLFEKLKTLADELQSMTSENIGNSTAYDMIMSDIGKTEEQIRECLKPYLVKKDIKELLYFPPNEKNFQQTIQSKHFNFQRKERRRKKKNNRMEIIKSQETITPDLSEENILKATEYILNANRNLSQTELRNGLIQHQCNRTFEQKDKIYKDKRHPLYLLSGDISNLMISGDYFDRMFVDTDKDGNKLRRYELKRLEEVNKNISKIKESQTKQLPVLSKDNIIKGIEYILNAKQNITQEQLRDDLITLGCNRTFDDVDTYFQQKLGVGKKNDPGYQLAIDIFNYMVHDRTWYFPFVYNGDKKEELEEKLTKLQGQQSE